jgi:glycosyltransferase involved in cell wall biosynthesis
MPNPLVEIITPVYNCEKYLAATIQSIRIQDYPYIHHLVIDDASTDGTDGVIDRYKPISYRHSVNLGEQVTVNEGLSQVTGKYFMIVNADDPLLPGAVSSLVGMMERCPSVLCAYPDWNSINEDGSFKFHVESREWDFQYMVRHHTCLPSVGSIFRADILKIIGGRDTSFKWLGDFDYWLRTGLAGPMLRVDETLATWRNRDGQASQVKSQARAAEHVRIMRKFFNNPGITDELLEIKDEAICWSYLVAATVTDSKTEIAGYIKKAVGVYPKLLVDVGFYDALARRANYVLRR